MSIPTLTNLKDWSHALAAVVGVLMLVLGAVQQGLAQYDPSISTKYAAQLIAFGGILTMLSKGFDAINNMATATTGTNPAPAPAPPANPQI